MWLFSHIEPDPRIWYRIEVKDLWTCVITFCVLLYSTVFLFVRVLIHHPFLTLTPSTLLPTWHALPLLDLFHLTSWNTCPIRFRHLSEARGFPCSITVLVSLASLLKLWFQDTLQFSRDTLDTVFFSHEATPLSSNLIDIKESSGAKLRVQKWGVRKKPETRKKTTKFKLKTSAATWVSKMQILLHPDAINQYLNAKNPNASDNQTGDTFDAL